MAIENNRCLYQNPNPQTHSSIPVTTKSGAPVNTMQQRGTTTAMDADDEKTSPPPARGRHNSRTKLVRSQAMREEASPPREPSPAPLPSPSIKVIPSSESSPRSASPAAVASPCRSPICVSPTSTLVPSPNSRCSPHTCDHDRPESGDDSGSSPKYLNTLNNRQNLEKTCASSKLDVASHLNNKKKFYCDCSNQNCIQCAKNQERNINNNLTNINNNVVHGANSLNVARGNSKGKLRQQSSSQGSFEGSASNSPCPSRDSSIEQYTDTSGIDLELFIPETLNRNAKDRAFMLRIEQELVSLAEDRFKTHFKFPPMSSYQRMLVHRCAAYFGMDHNIEASGKCVVVNKTKNTRIPDVKFKTHIKEDVVFSEEPRRSILKRDSNSVEDYGFKSPDRQFSMENRRSKSFEEREEKYEQVRRRIFNMEMSLRQRHDGDDFELAEIPWSSTESDGCTRFRVQLPDHSRRARKLSKGLSEEPGETTRPHVAKSYSFGGYGGALHRGDSVASTHSAGPRLLTKQGFAAPPPNANEISPPQFSDSGASSVSWRLSPSSSGYKSQSQMSESVTPSPTSTPHPLSDAMRQDSNGSEDKEAGDQVVWAVTDIQSVPKGSIIIDPQTREPMKNHDGSMYYYDPGNPPPGFLGVKPPPSPVTERQLSPKKRSLHQYAPAHKSHVTNSSTSPSLPYSPPLLPQQQRSFQFLSGMGENIPNIHQQQQQQQYPIYGAGFNAPNESMPMYQQPCIVYTTPYGVPVSPQYESRIEPPPEMGGTYYVNVTDTSVAPPPAYQQPQSPYWNQQQPITFYQNPQTTPQSPQRFPLPMHNQPHANYMSSYPQQNFMAPPPSQAPPSDLVSLYPHVVYSNPPGQGNPPVMYPPCQPPNIMYAPQNPCYSSGPVYPQAMPQYPQNTSTPNGFSVQEQNHGNVMQLGQNLSQMGLVHNPMTQPPPPVANQNYQFSKMGGQHVDLRAKACIPKMNKFNVPKGFLLGSSQSSTGTNSPAATVVAGYCPPTCPQNPGMYRASPETPPSQFNYGPGFPIPSMLFRQMSNVRPTTPGTARSSRSPTPAGDMPAHFDRQRLPTLYHGMSYVLQPDGCVPGRGQPNVFRQPPPFKQQNFGHGPDSRTHKPRKSKGNNKMSGLPPDGKPL